MGENTSFLWTMLLVLIRKIYAGLDPHKPTGHGKVTVQRTLGEGIGLTKHVSGRHSVRS